MGEIMPMTKDTSQRLRIPEAAGRAMRKSTRTDEAPRTSPRFSVTLFTHTRLLPTGSPGADLYLVTARAL